MWREEDNLIWESYTQCKLVAENRTQLQVGDNVFELDPSTKKRTGPRWIIQDIDPSTQTATLTRAYGGRWRQKGQPVPLDQLTLDIKTSRATPDVTRTRGEKSVFGQVQTGQDVWWSGDYGRIRVRVLSIKPSDSGNVAEISFWSNSIKDASQRTPGQDIEHRTVPLNQLSAKTPLQKTGIVAKGAAKGAGKFTNWLANTLDQATVKPR